MVNTTESAKIEEPIEASLKMLDLASGVHVEDLAHTQLTFGFYSDLTTLLELTENQFFDLLGISVGTRRRLKKTKKLTVMESDYAFAQSQVIHDALELFERDSKATVNWFVSPCIALSGYTPASLLSTLVGIKTVRALIWKIEHGVYP